MPETFAALLTAHLLGDFVLQPDWMARGKMDPRALLTHALIVTAVTLLLLGSMHIGILATVFLTHLGIDAAKANWSKDGATSFVVDQFFHVAVLLVLASFFRDATANGSWAAAWSPEVSDWYYGALSFTSGIVLSVVAGGVLINKLTAPFIEEIGNDHIEGLRNGGRYIGWLERLLVMLLLLIGQPGGIGFLVAAKSILRFGEIKEPQDRKVAEYIIIGTFLSFGWGLLVAVLTRRAIQYWL